jgi:hypothetical protein
MLQQSKGIKMNRKQLTVFFILLVVYAVCAFATYAFFADMAAASAGVPMPKMRVSSTMLGLANAGIVFVVYGMAGLAGYWFARKPDLPGIYSEDGNCRRWHRRRDHVPWICLWDMGIHS